MDDARNLQYGIGFDTADAETSVENLGEKVETLEENIGAVEVGAQQMGASAVSACQMGQGAAERFTGAVGDASGGLDDMASSASEAGNAAQKAAGHWNMTAEGLSGWKKPLRLQKPPLRVSVMKWMTPAVPPGAFGRRSKKRLSRRRTWVPHSRVRWPMALMPARALRSLFGLA